MPLRVARRDLLSASGLERDHLGLARADDFGQLSSEVAVPGPFEEVAEPLNDRQFLVLLGDGEELLRV